MTERELGVSYLRDIIRSFSNCRSLGEAAIVQVAADSDLHDQLDPQSNSIAIIVKHVGGNLRSRYTDFLTTDGEKPDRNRDGEFEITEPVSREEIMKWWDAGWTTVMAALEALTPDDLDRTVQVRGETFQVVEALNRSVTHTAYHVGQIVYLARHLAGSTWTTLTIPKGKSAEAKGNYKQRHADVSRP
jgi:Protein of unknown function (DUF1572)